MLLDVRPDHLRMVGDILQKHVPQYEVWAFGSRTKWTAKDHSDLDLCVVSDKPLSFSVLGAMAEDFSDSDLPWKVDVVDWATTSESFRKIIERDKVVVQEAKRGGGKAGDWRIMTLQDAFEINPRREIKRGTVTPFIPMDALSEHSREIARIDAREYTGSGARFKNRDTLLARITPCLENGKTAYVSGLEDDAVAHGSTEYIVIAEKQNVSDGLFAYYLARSSEFRIFAIGHMEGTSGRQRVPTDAVAKFQFNLPPLPEQKSIAHILGTLDDKIELNRRMNATLESMARALFQSWFVDFDPVRAKLDGCKPAGLDAATAALFPAHFQDSTLGHIPQGWQATTLGDVIEISDSKRIPLSGREREARQGKYPYHGAASVMDYVDDFLFDGIYVLMGEDGSVVNEDGTPVLQYVWDKFWVNNHAHVLRGKNGISTEHLLLHLKGSNIAPFVNGAVQPKLNQGNMNRIPFMLPPLEIGKAFAKAIKPLFAQIRANTEQSRTLATIRDALLPKLLSGELSVQMETTITS